LSWITNDWKLKLLALGLSVLMLGAVAFSQNPPTSKTLTKSIDYSSLPANLIVINPPTRTPVTVLGPADLVSSVSASSVVASIDLSKVTAGPNVSANLVVRSLVTGVSVANPVVPVALYIDQRAKIALQVEVRTPNVTPGWKVTDAYALCPNKPCNVQFDGPVSWETNLKAFVEFTTPVQFTSDEVPTQTVSLAQNGTLLDLTRLTLPRATLDINIATIRIFATPGTTSQQAVLINSLPANPPPTCYQITGLRTDPPTVVLTGSPQDLANLTKITLPPLDLSGHTSDFTFKVPISPLLPASVTASVTTAQVTYSISRVPNCT
jgi:YbbR-like protein